MDGVDKARKKAILAFWGDASCGDDMRDQVAHFNAGLDAFLSALKEEGMVLVPVKPTREMICAGISTRHEQSVPEAWSLATENIYAAMIEAALAAQERE